MGRGRPLALRLAEWMLWFLTAWGALAIVILLENPPVDLLLRWVLLAIVTGAGAWCLLKGILWGYVLGIVVGLYWLYLGTALYLVSGTSDVTIAIASVVYAAIGSFVLVGLLMPSSRTWFGTAWRARHEATVVR